MDLQFDLAIVLKKVLLWHFENLATLVIMRFEETYAVLLMSSSILALFMEQFFGCENLTIAQILYFVVLCSNAQQLSC